MRQNREPRVVGREEMGEKLQGRDFPFPLRWTPADETLRGEIGSVLKNDRGSSENMRTKREKQRRMSPLLHRQLKQERKWTFDFPPPKRTLLRRNPGDKVINPCGLDLDNT
ncbi:hypothetical protein TNCV_1354421 [Trichonephila clavipes]|nr:hypothetical protein TNCV_1354421 [Trichonephila clavipes]